MTHRLFAAGLALAVTCIGVSSGGIGQQPAFAQVQLSSLVEQKIHATPQGKIPTPIYVDVLTKAIEGVLANHPPAEANAALGAIDASQFPNPSAVAAAIVKVKASLPASGGPAWLKAVIGHAPPQPFPENHFLLPKPAPQQAQAAILEQQHAPAAPAPPLIQLQPLPQAQLQQQQAPPPAPAPQPIPPPAPQPAPQPVPPPAPQPAQEATAPPARPQLDVRYNAPEAVPLGAPTDFRLVIASAHPADGEFTDVPGAVKGHKIDKVAYAKAVMIWPKALVDVDSSDTAPCQSVTSHDNPSWDWYVTPKSTQPFELHVQIWEVSNCNDPAPVTRRIDDFPLTVSVTWWQTISNWISTLNDWLKALFALMTAGAAALAAWKWVIPPIRKILRLGN